MWRNFDGYVSNVRVSQHILKRRRDWYRDGRPTGVANHNRFFKSQNRRTVCGKTALAVKDYGTLDIIA